LFAAGNRFDLKCGCARVVHQGDFWFFCADLRRRSYRKPAATESLDGVKREGNEGGKLHIVMPDAGASRYISHITGAVIWHRRPVNMKNVRIYSESRQWHNYCLLMVALNDCITGVQLCGV
jgi:hypothetical protein